MRKAALKSPISPVKNESFGEIQKKMQIVNYETNMNDGKNFIFESLMYPYFL